MKKKKINPLILIGIIGVCTIGTNLAVQMYRAFLGPRDIWWTPKQMALPIEKTRNNFQVFINKKSLDQHLSDQTLAVVDSSGTPTRINSNDIKVQLNNWHKTRATLLAFNIPSAILFGVVLALLVMGLAQTLGRKSKASDA